MSYMLSNSTTLSLCVLRSDNEPGERAGFTNRGAEAGGGSDLKL